MTSAALWWAGFFFVFLLIAVAVLYTAFRWKKQKGLVFPTEFMKLAKVAKVVTVIAVISFAGQWAWARFKPEPQLPIKMECRDGYHELPQGRDQYKVILVAPPCGDTWTAWYRQPLSARESKRMDILNHNVLDFELKFENGMQLLFEDWTPVDEGEFRFTPITGSNGQRRRPQIVGFRVRNKMREPTTIEVLVSPRKKR